VFSSKRAIRQTYSRTIDAAGVVLCEILSDSNGTQMRLKENKDISQQLMAWRSKLGMVSEDIFMVLMADENSASQRRSRVLVARTVA
jgi:hypothetical protein